MERPVSFTKIASRSGSLIQCGKQESLMACAALVLVTVATNLDGQVKGNPVTQDIATTQKPVSLSANDDLAASNWVKEHAIPLKTVEAGHGFEDMEPLKTVIGNARIVALGEATHGTREFFQLKH
jgi:hypothetical protein